MKNNKNILITGCSSGIGLATVTLFLRNNYQVFATARNTNDVTELKKLGAQAVQMDIADSTSIDEALTTILSQCNYKIDILINNCGYGQLGAVEDLGKEQMEKQFLTNVFGPMELTNKIIKIMRKQNSGHILFIGSMLGFISMPYQGAYSMTKHAQESLVDAYAQELIHSDIKISLIELGPVRTQFFANSIKDSGLKEMLESSAHSESYKKFLDFVNNSMPCVLSRFVNSPEQIAEALLKIINLRKPKRRYYVTTPCKGFAIANRIIPRSILEKCLQYVANIYV